MKFTPITQSNAVARFPAFWQEFEQRFHVLLTLHDHVGVFTMPDGSRLLPQHNIHQSPCCQYKRGKRLRCYQHCGHGAIIEGGKKRGLFRYQCWRGIVECVLPMFQGKELAATIFAGSFRALDFPVDNLPKYYRQHYLALPVWNDQLEQEVAFSLTLMGNALVQMANNLREAYPVATTGRQERIQRFLTANAGNQVTLADLAQELDLSISRTSHIVKELFSCSFATMLHQEQVKLAKKMLADGSLSLREVAIRCGFQNEFYFSRIFKQYCGLPPGVFRNRSVDQV